MGDIKQIPGEAEAIGRLRRGEIGLRPASLELIEEGLTSDDGVEWDAVVEATWSGKRYRFALEYKSRSTPKVFTEALSKLRMSTLPPETYPMLMAPYLSPDQLTSLEESQVSGIDLCGNGVLVVSGEVCIVRTGQPNTFPQSAPIKNVYRGKSSIVPRVFLARSRFSTISEIKDEIGARAGNVALSTVSKVVATLEEDLIVGRKSGEIRLLQAEKLLERLAANYDSPRITARFEGECDLDLGTLAERFGEVADLRFALTGASSCRRYAVMAREDRVVLYCSDLDRALKALGAQVRETSRFVTFELAETPDDVVFFDPRTEDNTPWAAPIQVYLELMRGDKRDRETAGFVQEALLGELTAQMEG